MNKTKRRLSLSQSTVVEWLAANTDRRLKHEFGEGTSLVFTHGPGVGHPKMTRATFDALVTRSVVVIDREYHHENVVGHAMPDGSTRWSGRTIRVYKLASPEGHQ